MEWYNVYMFMQSDITLHVILQYYMIIIHCWSYTSGESSNWSCVSIRTHISVTSGRNFLIWGMMDYYVGLMPIISKFLILSGILDSHKNVFPKGIPIF